jgi:hypothetical protein
MATRFTEADNPMNPNFIQGHILSSDGGTLKIAFRDETGGQFIKTFSGVPEDVIKQVRGALDDESYKSIPSILKSYQSDMSPQPSPGHPAVSGASESLIREALSGKTSEEVIGGYMQSWDAKRRVRETDYTRPGAGAFSIRVGDTVELVIDDAPDGYHRGLQGEVKQVSRDGASYYVSFANGKSDWFRKREVRLSR